MPRWSKLVRDKDGQGVIRTYLPEIVYGASDGIVTTFAIVSGVVGAALSVQTVLVLGFASLLADGFSMAASNYSGTKTDLENVERLREIENRHIDEVPGIGCRRPVGGLCWE